MNIKIIVLFAVSAIFMGMGLLALADLSVWTAAAAFLATVILVVFTLKLAYRNHEEARLARLYGDVEISSEPNEDFDEDELIAYLKKLH